MVQCSQNRFLRMNTKPYRNVTNPEIHNDLELKLTAVVIQNHIVKYKRRLHIYTNVEWVGFCSRFKEAETVKVHVSLL